MANTTTTSADNTSTSSLSTSYINNQPTPTTTLKPATDGWSYKGCYTDNESRTVIGNNSAQLQIDNNTVLACAIFCDGHNSTYMGLENGECLFSIHDLVAIRGINCSHLGNQCYCGDTIWPYSVPQEDGNCSTACPGNELERCGGFWKISIYEGDLPTPRLNYALSLNKLANARKKVSSRSILLFGDHLLPRNELHR